MKASDYAPTILTCLVIGLIFGIAIGWKLAHKINDFQVRYQVRSALNNEHKIAQDLRRDRLRRSRKSSAA
jgi:hypothetical protein